MLYPKISSQVVDAFYEVCRNLNRGYAEKVYEKAYIYELRKLRLRVEEQKPLHVIYKGEINVGDFIADMIVDDKILIELKAVSEINESHEAQLINYLTTTGIPIGYVFNFGGSRKFLRRLGPGATSMHE